MSSSLGDPSKDPSVASRNPSAQMSLRGNIRAGIIAGLAVAAVFSILATASALLRSVNPLVDSEWLRSVATYFPGGAVVGAVGGAMRPLGQSLRGSMLVGAVLGALIGIIFSLGWNGRSGWGGDNEVYTACFAVMGLFGGPYTRTLVQKLRERQAQVEAQDSLQSRRR